MKNPNTAILFSALVTVLFTAIMGSYGASEGTLMIAGLATFAAVHLAQGLCFARYRSAMLPPVVISQHPSPGQEYSIDNDTALSSAITKSFAEQRFMDKDRTDPVPEAKGRILIYQKLLKEQNKPKTKSRTYNGFTVTSRNSLTQSALS